MRICLALIVVATTLLVGRVYAQHDDEQRLSQADMAGQLANQLCLSFALPGGDLDTKMLSIIASHMDEYRLGEPSTKNMLRYLNANKNDMLCGGDYPRLWLTRAAVSGMGQSVFNVFFLDYLITDDEYIDVNAVEINDDGKPSTLVDYLDYLVARYETEGSVGYAAQFDRLRTDLIDPEGGFGAKRYVELQK